MNYSAVIFDLFGTLIDNASPEDLVRLFRDPAVGLGGDADEFAQAWISIYSDRAVGRLGGVENEIRHVCRMLGRNVTEAQVSKALRLRLDAYRRHCRPRPTVIDTLSKLRASRIKIGLISDCGSEVPDVWPDLEFAPLVDAAVFSCRAGVTKPDPRLYKTACAMLGVDPSHCLYVGDGGSRELTGAVAVGMDAVLIQVDYDRHFDAHRPDAAEWTGPVISEIRDVLRFVLSG